MADPITDVYEAISILELYSEEVFIEFPLNVSTIKDLFARGTLFLGVYLTNPEIGICRITHLYVRKEYRNLKLGRLLVCKALNFAHELNNSCILYVKKSNTVALRLYSSIGFQVVTEFQELELKG